MPLGIKIADEALRLYPNTKPMQELCTARDGRGSRPACQRVPRRGRAQRATGRVVTARALRHRYVAPDFGCNQIGLIAPGIKDGQQGLGGIGSGMGPRAEQSP